MIINIFFILINIIYLIITLIEDIKKKETYDFYNYSYIFLMIIFAISYILIFEKYELLSLVSFSFFLGFFFALFLFFIGFWGGGDSKLLIGLSITIPFLNQIFNPQIIQYDISRYLYYYDITNFSYIFLFLNILIFMILFYYKEKKRNIFHELSFLIILTSMFFIENKLMIYLGVVLVFLFFLREEIFDLKIKSRKINYVNYIIIFEIFLLIIYFLKVRENLDSFNFMITFLTFSILSGCVFMIFYSIILYLKNYKINKIYLFLFFVNLCLLFYFYIKQNILFSIFSIILCLFLIIFFRKIEKDFFVVKKKLSEITLGDWVFQDIKKNKKIIFTKKDFHLGIDEKQLKTLKKNFSLSKVFLVKDGIAFIPFLFCGFMIYLIVSLII